MANVKRCQNCGKRVERTHTHHISYQPERTEEWCPSCHLRYHHTLENEEPDLGEVLPMLQKTWRERDQRSTMPGGLSEEEWLGGWAERLDFTPQELLRRLKGLPLEGTKR